MLGKRPRSVIGKLSELLVSGSAGLLESAAAAAAAASSPRSPLDFKIQSPRGPRSYDLGGVGLGIVAALEKSGDAKILLLPRSCACARAWGSARPAGPSPAAAGGDPDDDMEEDYTYVTFHGPDQSFTMVYYGEGECGKSDGESMRRAGSGGGEGDGPVFPALDFLNSCQLCGKQLQGEDVYMYRFSSLQRSTTVNLGLQRVPLETRKHFAAPSAGRCRSGWTSAKSSADRKLRELPSGRDRPNRSSRPAFSRYSLHIYESII